MIKNWIFLRGLTRGSGHWGTFPDVFRSLNEGVQIELQEIPGNGTRFAEQTPLLIDKVIHSIRTQSQFVKKGQSFHLLGVSLGGMVSMQWAQKFPAEIQSLSLVNTSFANISPFYFRLNPNSFLKVMKALLETDIYQREKIILELISSNPIVRSRYLETFAELSKSQPVQMKNFFRQLVLASRCRPKNKLNTPTKIICSRGDMLVSYKCSIEICEKFQLTPIVHPTAGHDIALDDPDWLAKQILA